MTLQTSFPIPGDVNGQTTHRLLQRQLKRYVSNPETIPEDWQAFVAAVNQAYWQADEDRARLERTLELNSQELLQANSNMQMLLQNVEAQVEKRTNELTQTNAELQTALKELQQAQTQLIQTEKMSSLGQLVAGVAHEINNPVSFVHGNLIYANEYAQKLLQLINLYQQHHPEPAPPIQAEIDQIDLSFLAQDLPKLLTSMQVGVDRIKQIVLSLRNFSRMDEAATKAVDIHEGIESTLMILQHRLTNQSRKFSIEVVKQFGDLPIIECYAGQLNQVFMNILVNAIDALEVAFHSPKNNTLEQKSRYRLDAAISSTKAIPKITISTEYLKPNWVCIRIADNGLGIPEAIRTKLFDPFFTTKPVGKGTGLGLSISHQIVTRNHGGSLQCKSTLGLGAEFEITIPVKTPIPQALIA
jgi:two-component system NtrC family sensor kinase